MMRKDEFEDALARACNRDRLRKERPLVRSRETIKIHDIAGAKGAAQFPRTYEHKPVDLHYLNIQY